MSVVAVETGTGEGFTARVSAEGRLLTDAGDIQSVEEVQRIVDPVTIRAEVVEVATSTPTATTSSSEVVSVRTGRRGLEIQNLGTHAVHIVLDGSSSATTANRRLDPGGVFTLPAGMTYEGAVRAIAVDASCALSVVEFYVD